jgi:hypothetical protein
MNKDAVGCQCLKVLLHTNGRPKDTAEQDTNNRANGSSASKYSKRKSTFWTHGVSSRQDGQRARDSETSTHTLEGTANRHDDRILGEPIDNSPDGKPSDSQNVNATVTKKVSKATTD